MQEILTGMNVPVIFITAFPERLLTGDRPEPAFLLTKPYQPATLRAAIERQLDAVEVQAVITTGGTGISRRDGTYEVVSGLIEKRIDGFGELFRALSFEEIGPAAMLSRACAGTARGTIVISLPGSQNAVRLGMTKLVIPELGHLVREVTR